MSGHTSRWLAATLLVAVVAPAGSGADKPAAGEVFGHQILPILEAKCLKCHGEGGKTRGGLDLSSLADVLKGGDSGPAVVPGKSRESLLWKQISDNAMPPKDQGGRITYDELQAVAKWIDSSAFPDARAAAAASAAAVYGRAKSLWSFQPVKRPEVPEVDGAVNPVDAFVGRKLAATGRRLSPEADRGVLVRRVTFDLHGLPPTPEEVEAFAADRGPDAWGNLIKRLLASPRYGERWGRHWLDVAGYADSGLFMADAERKGFWRYRDYVIRAFNDDMPYDRFVREQLAGDELVDWRAAEKLGDATQAKLVATGFLRCTPDATDNQFITQDEKIYFTQQTSVEVATKALLGLTLNCVRCHDHKYDPITQEDYFRVVGIFQPAYDPAKWLPGSVNKYAPGPWRVIPAADRAGREEFVRRMAELRRRSEERSYNKNVAVPGKYRDRYLRDHLGELPPSFDGAALAAALGVEAAKRGEGQAALVEDAAKRLGVTSAVLVKAYPEMLKEIEALGELQTRLNDEGQRVGEPIWALWDVSTDPSPTRLLVRGDYRNPSREITPGILRALDDPTKPWKLPAPDAARQTTGRRLAFAEWVTRPDHPLTARVMANRVWQYHFGTGLVATPDDFGARGARPTHPELLDWLAAEFVASGWSVKHLHRLILTSATWRQRSSGGATDLAAFPRRRLEAEAIRDAMLHAAGLLDLKAGGTPVRTVQMPDGTYDVPEKEPGRYRRTVYLSTRRTMVPTLLRLFDAPQMDTNWPRRTDSAIAPQALALTNSPFVIECADALAKRVLAERPDRRLDRAFALVYNRPPAAAERKLFADALAGPLGTEREAWRTIAHALLASNEFLYPD